ncbi:MAG: VOC family protein [Clostridiales bacterium]|jgi:PhnB protein|nr:VOC family protein [Clostridiales bacterium]
MVEPYITMNGRAAKAMDFYEEVFGAADKRVMLYSEAPGNRASGDTDGWVLHGEMNIMGTNFSFSDQSERFKPSSLVSLVIRPQSEEETRRLYARLTEGGGEILMVLAPQFYAKLYAWVRDKFGVDWQIIFG